MPGPPPAGTNKELQRGPQASGLNGDGSNGQRKTYCVLWDPKLFILDTTTHTFVDPASATWANCVIWQPEITTSGIYAANMPSGVAGGQRYLQDNRTATTANTPVISDTPASSAFIDDWNGFQRTGTPNRFALFQVQHDGGGGNAPGVVMINTVSGAFDDEWKDYVAIVLDGTYAGFRTAIKGSQASTNQISFERATPATLADGVNIGIYRESGLVGSTIRTALFTQDVKAWIGSNGGFDLDPSATYGQLLDIMAGLLGRNIGVLNQVYDGSNNLTDADINLYDTAAHALTNDGVTGLVHQFRLHAVYGANETQESTRQIS